MVNFPVLGIWWRPSAPNTSVTGTLDQEPNGNFLLNTHSGLVPDAERLQEDGREVLYGEVNGSPVTLRDCYWTSISGSFPSSQETWHAWSALFGVHLQEDHQFERIEIESEYLDRWIDAPQWTYNLAGTERGLRLHNETEFEAADYTGGTLGVNFGISVQPGQSKWTVSRITTLTVAPTTPITLAECLNVIRQYDTLLDSVFGRRTAATSIALYAEGAPKRLFTGYEFVGAHAAPELSAGPDTIETHRSRLFTFNDAGGIEGVARWFGLDRKYHHLAARVMSQFRTEGRFLEDTTMSTFAAGEALDRAETGFENSTARTRWKRLAGAVPQFHDALIQPLTVDQWAHLVATERDRVAHILGAETNQQDAQRMIALQQSAQLLNVLSLLRLAGLDAAIPGSTSSSRWSDTRCSYLLAKRFAGF